jgi:hypothetical protein
VKVLKWMVIFTSIGSVLYCLQTVVGSSLLNNVTDDYNPSALDLQFNNGVARYYNLPVYVIPVLFLLLFDKSIMDTDLRIAMIVPNIGAIILSQHRNLLIAVIVCCIVYYIISKNLKFGKIALIVCASFALLVGADTLMGNRLSEGLSDVKEIFTNGLTDQELMDADLADMSTSEFRFYLLYERWNYVTRDVQHALFGIGLLTEDSYKVRSLNFNVGGTLDDTGRIAQVDTSDIAWSPLIINFGIAGTLIFLSMYTSILKKFYGLRNSKIMMVGILYIISLFFTSFYSILIMAQSTICFLMLLAAYQFRLKTEATAAA